MATQYAIPATRGELDALKANLTDGFGKIVGQVAGRAPEIEAAYNEVAAQIRQDAAARYGRDQETARQQQAGMAAAAQSLGVQPVSLGANSRSGRLSQALSAQYNGDAEGWGDYLGEMRGHAVGRNQAAADAFGEDGRHMRDTMERQFQEYLAGLAASGGGGGGGGGRGGRGRRNYEDEPLVEYPKVAPMSAGVKQGLVGSSIRQTAMGIAAQSAGKLNSAGDKWLGPKNSQGVNSSGIDPNVLKRALAQSRAKR